LKTWPKQILGSLPLVIALPRVPERCSTRTGSILDLKY